MLVWAVSTIFTQMTLCPPDGYPFLYHSIYEFFVQHVAFSKVLAVVMMLLEMLFLQRFFTINKFADNQTMMPVLFFLLFVNVGGFLKVFSPINFTVLLTTFILLCVVHMRRCTHLYSPFCIRNLVYYFRIAYLS